MTTEHLPTPEQALGLVIRNRRKVRGWSQEDLGFESGLHRTYIGVLERGEKNISLRNLILVASTLGAKASELLDEAGL
ncbi:helix-turn-helix transcriptional regulator [Zoogloea sp.]|uniref:helix-turn-helix domain-containing protein n=1 Tax=Zoogloea sp. TaxID=49181 RepID=UPI0025EB4CA1|nr:helix-turn-helix transcriptional regulator [Zoogloea sp.]MCK6395682.1 helix-turn-helix transcriptional regulator [Zoogloea sp.]